MCESSAKARTYGLPWQRGVVHKDSSLPAKNGRIVSEQSLAEPFGIEISLVSSNSLHQINFPETL
jgi:hypothetical protein